MSTMKERLKKIFGKNVTVDSEIAETEVKMTEEEMAIKEKNRLDNFYGCDEDGNPGFEFSVMDIRSIGSVNNEKPQKVTLVNIDSLKERVSIWGLMSAFRGTGKSEWEFMWAWQIMSSLRKAWKNGESTCDITWVFNHDALATMKAGYTGKTKEVEGNVYRCIPQEDIREVMFRIFTVENESNEELTLSINVA